jgi:hypothetical protein
MTQKYTKEEITDATEKFKTILLLTQTLKPQQELFEQLEKETLERYNREMTLTPITMALGNPTQEKEIIKKLSRISKFNEFLKVI